MSAAEVDSANVLPDIKIENKVRAKTAKSTGGRYSNSSENGAEDKRNGGRVRSHPVKSPHQERTNDEDLSYPQSRNESPRTYRPKSGAVNALDNHQRYNPTTGYFGDGKTIFKEYDYVAVKEAKEKQKQEEREMHASRVKNRTNDKEVSEGWGTDNKTIFEEHGSYYEALRAAKEQKKKEEMELYASRVQSRSNNNKVKGGFGIDDKTIYEVHADYYAAARALKEQKKKEEIEMYASRSNNQSVFGHPLPIPSQVDNPTSGGSPRTSPRTNNLVPFSNSETSPSKSSGKKENRQRAVSGSEREEGEEKLQVDSVANTVDGDGQSSGPGPTTSPSVSCSRSPSKQRSGYSGFEGPDDKAIFKERELYFEAARTAKEKKKQEDREMYASRVNHEAVFGHPVVQGKPPPNYTPPPLPGRLRGQENRSRSSSPRYRTPDGKLRTSLGTPIDGFTPKAGSLAPWPDPEKNNPEHLHREVSVRAMKGQQKSASLDSSSGALDEKRAVSVNACGTDGPSTMTPHPPNQTKQRPRTSKIPVRRVISSDS